MGKGFEAGIGACGGVRRFINGDSLGIFRAHHKILSQREFFP
jgi:hypothetical protein